MALTSVTEISASSALSVHSTQVLHRLGDLLNAALSKLLPQSDSSARGVWDDDCILTLTAIFELQRVELYSDSPERRLDLGMTSRVIHSLVTTSFFPDLKAPNLLRDMEALLRLIAGALRVYKYTGRSLEYTMHKEIYDGITRLWNKFTNNRNTRASSRRVEDFNVAFLLKHCQYLLISIDSSESFRRKFSRTAVQVFDITMAGLARSFHNIRPMAFEMMQLQRSRPRWHDEFEHLEDICWSIFAGDIRIRTTEDPDEYVSTLVEEATDLTSILLETMEYHLPQSSQRSNKLKNFALQAKGRATEAMMNAGPYEENTEYFRYGVLDLIYQLSFRIRTRARQQCFPEFVKVIGIVLERSPRDAFSLHVKATDLWNRILELGRQDRTRYGREEDRNAITNWINEHLDKTEKREWSEE